MTNSNRYICFNIGEQEYAVPLLSIKEVLGLPEITSIPQCPPHFLGVCNLRGNVISVVDLRVKIGEKPKNTDETSVMILDLGHYMIGVVVDKINAVLTIKEEEVSEKPIIESNRSTDYIQGIFKQKDQLVLLISKILSIEDHNMLSKQIKVAA
jgi:purine-binding chemotaxis protein CheW